MKFNEKFSKATAGMGSSMIRELVATTKGIPGLISLAGGFPSPDSFNKEDIAECYKEVVLESGNDILQYGASEGDAQLKEELIKWEEYKNMSMDEMLITVGSTNAIYYYAKTFINPGDVILCEAPSFLGSLVSFEAEMAELISIEMDDEGINIDKLKQAIADCKTMGKKIKFLYTIPDFQNPTGISMSAQRRMDLVELMAEVNIPILEDNPYSELRYTGEMIPSIFKIAEEKNLRGLVTLVKSFSKILGPGLRVAYAVSSEEIIGKMCSWQQKVNVSPGCVTERMVARFMQKDLLVKQIGIVNDLYTPYWEAMLTALEDFMPKTVKWTKPEGGMFVWLTLPEGVDADELFVKAREQKVAFIPGSKFFPKGQEQHNCLRLNYSYAKPDAIREGVKRLASIM